MATSKPLRIALHPTLGSQPWVEELRTKGHEILWVALETAGADLILGPNCMRFIPGMEKFLESFLKGARVVKYPGSRKDAP
mgnify:FL=1